MPLNIYYMSSALHGLISSSAPKAAGADSDNPVASVLEDEQAANKAADDADDAESFGGGEEEARDQGDMDYEGGDWDIS